MKQPDVLKRFRGTRGVLVRKLFWYLYQECDSEGIYEFASSEIAKELGYSRRSIQRASKHLQQVNLLHVHKVRLGRGRHSLYKVNWRKNYKAPAQCVSAVKKWESWVPKDVEDLEAKITFFEGLDDQSKNIIEMRAKRLSGVKCATPKRKYIKTNTSRGEREWRFAMSQFRSMLSDNPLTGPEVKRCMQVLGKHLKGKDRGYLRRLWESLSVLRLHTPKRCWENPDNVYAWFGAVLAKVK